MHPCGQLQAGVWLDVESKEVFEWDIVARCKIGACGDWILGLAERGLYTVRDLHSLRKYEFVTVQGGRSREIGDKTHFADSLGVQMILWDLWNPMSEEITTISDRYKGYGIPCPRVWPWNRSKGDQYISTHSLMTTSHIPAAASLAHCVFTTPASPKQAAPLT
jgi:hypothetical protein